MKSLFFRMVLLHLTFSFIESRLAYFRHCRNRAVDRVEFHNISSQYSSDVRFGENGTKIELKINISWQVVSPEDTPLDGFLIRFIELLSRESSMQPISGCQLGNEYLWVTSENRSSCTNTSILRDMCSKSSEHECLCNAKTCGILYGGETPTCLGADKWVLDKGYLSIQPNVRNLVFKANFNSHYVFDIKPYYRKNVGRLAGLSYVVPTSANCIESLKRDAMMRSAEAAETCCDVGVPHVTARNVTVGKSIPDFQRDTVNVTVTWLPPINDLNLTGFHFFPIAFNQFHVSLRSFPKYTLPKKIFTPSLTYEEDVCDKITYYFEVTIYDLVPGETYNLQLSSIYQQREMKKYGCRGGQCLTNEEFVVPEMNACEWNYCDENAICTPENTFGNITLKSTCQCKPGFEGDGINSTWSEASTGCRDANYCKNIDLYCDQVASCEDKLAPLEGVNCICPPGHFGDGLIDGSGCTSSTVLGVKIGIPVAIAFALLIIAIAWKARVYELYKKTFKFARFST